MNMQRKDSTGQQNNMMKRNKTNTNQFNNVINNNNNGNNIILNANYNNPQSNQYKHWFPEKIFFFSSFSSFFPIFFCNTFLIVHLSLSTSDFYIFLIEASSCLVKTYFVDLTHFKNNSSNKIIQIDV